MPRSANPNGTMNAAGILNANGKLTPEAKEKFITEVEQELLFGTPDISFLCGESILPAFGSDRLDLHDEETYKAFHQSWVTKYEEIANILNFPKCQIPSIVPLIDITIFMSPLPKIDLSLAIELMTLSLPDLAIKLPDLGLKLPQPFPPDIPPPFPDFSIPNFDFGFDLSLDLPHIQFQIDLILKLPSILLELALPDIVLPKLTMPSLLLPEVCKLLRERVFSSEHDGTRYSGADTTNLAASLVLSRNTSKMVVVDVCGLVVGCGGVITAGVSESVGLTPPPIEKAEPSISATFYETSDQEFWDHYIYMCNRLEIDPLILGQVIQFESQWVPFNKVIGGATKAMGFVMTMPWWYQGNNKDAFPLGLRMKKDYWSELYKKNPTGAASKHASDDLFWTEQFLLNTWIGSKGRTFKEFKTPKSLYDNVINPSYNKESGHAPFTGATIKEPYKTQIEFAIKRIGTNKGIRLPQPDGTKSASIDWRTISLEDIKTHPIGTNPKWWRTLPET